MFETLTQGFSAAREKLSGVRALTEENVSESLRDVRMSLLEADVDLVVVRDFLARVKERALGERVETRVRDASGRTHRVTPGQHFVKTCAEELVALMGPVDASLQRRNGVASVMLVGLQGVGKTTVAGKLARHLQKEGSRPLLVAADVYRPAAVLQLQQLGERLGVPVHVGAAGEAPAHICAAAARRAEAEGFDAIVFDTAGRLAIDDALMQELDEIAAATRPANALLVCDALMGRDAVNVAKAFSERLKLDGLILTKLDGDARGGAALSIRHVTGLPIKFVGTGEKVADLESFHPERMVSRVLGMGDVLSLIEKAEESIDEHEALELEKKLRKNKFTLEDFRSQLRMVRKMGPLSGLVQMLPGMSQVRESDLDGNALTRVIAIVDSMTPKERANPRILNGSRKKRISRGAGQSVQEINRLLKQFAQIQRMMKAMRGGGRKGGRPRLPFPGR